MAPGGAPGFSVGCLSGPPLNSRPPSIWHPPCSPPVVQVWPRQRRLGPSDPDSGPRTGPVWETPSLPECEARRCIIHGGTVVSSALYGSLFNHRKLVTS